MEEIAAPIDFLGVNYYTRRICRSDKISENDNEPQTVQSRDEETGMGWEVYPEGSSEIFDRLHPDYGFKSFSLPRTVLRIAMFEMQVITSMMTIAFHICYAISSKPPSLSIEAFHCMANSPGRSWEI